MKKTTILKEVIKNEIRKVLKENELDEMARIATTIKIGNPEAAKAAKEQFAGKWIADMIDKVEAAGDAGIAQPDLATALGKGSQQAINPKVRELLASGIFTMGNRTTEPKPKAEPKASSEEKPKVEKPSKLKTDSGDDEGEKISTGVDSNAKKLDNLTKEMKAIAKEYTEAKKSGNKNKELELLNQLKEKQKEKTKLEKLVNISLGDNDLED